MSAFRITDPILTTRLILRRPTATDAEAIFDRYARHRDVTRYVGWPAHRSLDDTRSFLAFSDAEWTRWPCGPLLIVDRRDGRVLGGTGLSFEAPYRAMTGYVLAPDVWGQGYATETLAAIAGIAPSLGVQRLYAMCHVDHAPSIRVLEKCGFSPEGNLRGYHVFPNDDAAAPADVVILARVWRL